MTLGSPFYNASKRHVIEGRYYVFIIISLIKNQPILSILAFSNIQYR